MIASGIARVFRPTLSGTPSSASIMPTSVPPQASRLTVSIASAGPFSSSQTCGSVSFARHGSVSRRLGRLGLRAPMIEEEWRGYASLTWPENREAFIRTLRAVVDVGGQAVGYCVWRF